jgi:hypothetical protein
VVVHRACRADSLLTLDTGFPGTFLPVSIIKFSLETDASELELAAAWQCCEFARRGLQAAEEHGARAVLTLLDAALARAHTVQVRPITTSYFAERNSALKGLQRCQRFWERRGTDVCELPENVAYS